MNPKLCSWNVHGMLVDNRFVGYKRLIRYYNISFFCLIETKQHSNLFHDKMLAYKQKLFRDEGFVDIFSCSYGGHILLKWDSSIFSFDPLIITNQLVYRTIKLSNFKTFLLTIVYA